MHECAKIYKVKGRRWRVQWEKKLTSKCKEHVFSYMVNCFSWYPILLPLWHVNCIKLCTRWMPNKFKLNFTMIYTHLTPQFISHFNLAQRCPLELHSFTPCLDLAHFKCVSILIRCDCSICRYTLVSFDLASTSTNNNETGSTDKLAWDLESVHLVCAVKASLLLFKIVQSKLTKVCLHLLQSYFCSVNIP